MIGQGPDTIPLSARERRLLNDFQRDLPLTPRPYLAIAEALGVGEEEVLAMLARLGTEGALSRVGAVLRPNTLGASTLAAMAVPSERLEEVARQVSAHAEVTHNYEREHRFNLWFVVAAASEEDKQRVLCEIGEETGRRVMELPLLAEYHVDLGFELSWS